ncbi:MAG: SLBB domain-containing protein, partial [Clostridia bacterium]|nr:SLBB domain-containing protein [Clostridia bacterium]
MRFRIFRRIIYVPKGVLIIAGVLAAAAIIVVINLTDRKALPEMERGTGSDEKSVEEIVVTPVNGSEIIDNSTDPADATDRGSEPSTPAPTVDSRMAVHIRGAVVNEGVYRLEPGSIVEDAVLLCGGLLPEADTYCINLAMKVNDGMRIHIPFTFSEDKRWLLDVGYASYQ